MAYRLLCVIELVIIIGLMMSTARIVWLLNPDMVRIKMSGSC